MGIILFYNTNRELSNPLQLLSMIRNTAFKLIGQEVVFFPSSKHEKQSSRVCCSSSILKLRIKWLTVSQQYCTSRYRTRITGAHLMTRMCAVLLKTSLTACSAELAPYSTGFLFQWQGNLLQELPGFIKWRCVGLKDAFQPDSLPQESLGPRYSQKWSISACISAVSWQGKCWTRLCCLLLQCSWVSVKASMSNSFYQTSSTLCVSANQLLSTVQSMLVNNNTGSMSEL